MAKFETFFRIISTKDIMSSPIVLVSIPGLRRSDLSLLPQTMARLQQHSLGHIRHQFPSVTWPAQAHMLTGKLADEHGVVANGFYWRNDQRVEMWTAWNKVIERPQIWDLMRDRFPDKKSVAWFPMLSKGCNADFVAMPAPIHKPDGSEELWCYTKPQEFYGELLQSLGHFPLQHFWGPLANIKSSRWIADSVIQLTQKFHPDFFYIYIPHLDYAAQKFGPDSEEAQNAVRELDSLLLHLIDQLENQYHDMPVKWMLVSEYVIQSVDHVTYPNRILRQAGLLETIPETTGSGEVIDFANSPAWALVDHQFSHVFVKNRNPEVIRKVSELFENVEGIQSILQGENRAALKMDHERAGDVILVSNPNSWQAYYWWSDDARAPSFARTVDIHRKPGYDPVELFFDPTTRSIPLNADLIKGSHGIVTDETVAQAVFITQGFHTSLPAEIRDTDVCDLIMNELASDRPERRANAAGKPGQ